MALSKGSPSRIGTADLPLVDHPVVREELDPSVIFPDLAIEPLRELGKT
jgi:hypothetical protein